MIDMTKLRLALLVSLLIAGAALGEPASTRTPAESAKTSVATTERVVSWTYLKAKPGERARLKEFLVKNWLAMDAEAIRQGLMVDATVLDRGRDDGDWNLVVEVTYPDAAGYPAVAERFQAIRAKHTTVPIDGKVLKDLGEIVRSEELIENPAHARP
jgi:hypothetical protein